MLRLEHLTLTQGGFALSADLSVATGSKLALIGPSGAGKSTLLNLIAGFSAPDQGRVLWQDTDLTDLPPGQRPVSILFQDNNHFPHLTIAQNVGLGLRPDLKLSEDEQRQVREALHHVGLSGMEGRKPGTLSGGQQSRAALARVLVQKRPLVLLDEPFAALGPALKVEMLQLVDQVVQETGGTLIMVSHQPEDAKAIASHVSVVAEGTVTAPIATDQLFANPPQALRDYLGG